MTLHVCEHCTSKFPPDLDCCPNCGGSDHHEEGEMPKITVHGGATHAVDIIATEERDHPGTGVEMEEVETTVDEDGVAAGEITNDDSGEALPSVDEEQEAEGDDINNDVEPDAEPAAATLPRPATNASKAEWLTYARAVTGEDIADADYTKAELVELTGKG